jgi:hypothetical protein
MGAASISSFLRPGYPILSSDFSGNYYSHIYRGPTSTLQANLPVPGAEWTTGYYVRAASIQPLDNTLISEMVVESTVENSPGVVSIGPVANNEFPFYEIEWLGFEKSLRVHPAFQAFSVTVWQGIDAWINEDDTTARSQFSYWPRDKDGAVTVSVTVALNSDQQTFATLYNKGVESYVDYLPLARKTSLYQSTTSITADAVGQKIAGTPFSDVPSGYVWQKTGDRSSKQGRGFKWTKTEEWTGALTILVDVDDVFI